MNGSRFCTVVSLSFLSVSVVSADVSVTSTSGPQAGNALTAPACQIVDKEIAPVYRASMAVIPESRFEGYGDSGVVEMRGDRELAFYRNVLMADLDMRLDFAADLMLRSAGVDLPDQLVRCALDAGMTWRYINGLSVQVRVMPGVYSDMEEFSGDSLFLPFAGSLTYAFNPFVSGRVGLNIRPGFERAVYPVAYLVWAVAPACRIKAGFPQSRLTWFASDLWQFYLAADWRSDSYAIREKNSFDREMLSLEDYRIYAGASYGVSDELRVFGELGYVGQRDFEFGKSEEGVDQDLDVESALLLRVGLSGPF